MYIHQSDDLDLIPIIQDIRKHHITDKNIPVDWELPPYSEMTLEEFIQLYDIPFNIVETMKHPYEQPKPLKPKLKKKVKIYKGKFHGTYNGTFIGKFKGNIGDIANGTFEGGIVGEADGDFEGEFHGTKPQEEIEGDWEPEGEQPEEY